MKIVSSGRVLNSREFYEKKKKKRRIKFVLLFVGLLFIIFLLVYLSRLERFQIVDIKVLGENIIDKEEIIQATKHLLSGRYLWVVPRSNVLVYPGRGIERSLAEEFPRLKSVNLTLDEHRELLVTVDARMPFALYCTNASNDECFFLEEEGFIFAPAPSFSSGVYFVYLTQNPIENPIGKRFLTVEEFKSLSKFMETLTALNIHSLSLEAGDNEFTLTLSKGGQIIWRRDSNLALIHSNLEAFLSNDSIKAQKNFLDRISRLDLRINNQVRWVFKD